MADPTFIEDRENLGTRTGYQRADSLSRLCVPRQICSAVGSEEVKAAFEEQLVRAGLLMGKAAKGKNPHGSVVLTECESVGFAHAIGAAKVMVYHLTAFGTHRCAARHVADYREHLVMPTSGAAISIAQSARGRLGS